MLINQTERDGLFPHGAVLLCEPAYYDVTYEINPWMSVKRAPLKARASQQWVTLKHTLLRLGIWIEYVDPVAGLPDMVFTANAGLVQGKKVMLSRFRYQQRQGEELYFKKWFEEHGYKAVFPKNGFFEGAGDALFAGQTLFGAIGFRSDRAVYDEIAAFLDLKDIVICELVDPRFYHCDTCFCPVSDKEAIVYLPAFSQASIKAMEQRIELIPVEDSESVHFACNAVSVARNVILPVGCANITQKLGSRGYQVYELELDEFIKAGGASKCLTLRLY